MSDDEGEIERFGGTGADGWDRVPDKVKQGLMMQYGRLLGAWLGGASIQISQITDMMLPPPAKPEGVAMLQEALLQWAAGECAACGGSRDVFLARAKAAYNQVSLQTMHAQPGAPKS